MKIAQLLSKMAIPVSNEDHEFMSKYKVAHLDRLNEHELWVAQNLVRRGIYKLSNDNITIIKTVHD